MKALALVLLLSTPAFALDGNPLRPGFPPCLGKEEGHWQVYLEEREGKPPLKHLALTSIDFLDPAYVICWVNAPQLIIAGDLKPSTPVKQSRQRQDRTIGALHELYAEAR